MHAIICVCICTHEREHVHICMQCVHVSGRYMIFAVHAMMGSGLEHHVFLNPFSTQILCTTWLDPKALALLPGFCIVVLLLPVLKTWLFRDLPDCCHECPHFVPTFVPKFVPKFVPNNLSVTYTHDCNMHVRAQGNMPL
jgi:hypothetical protein